MYACNRMFTLPALVSVPPYSPIIVTEREIVTELTHFDIAWNCFYELFELLGLGLSHLNLIELKVPCIQLD